MREACAALVAGNAGSPRELAECLRVMCALLSNLRAKPDSDKFRRVNTSNAKVAAAVCDVAGAEAVLLACGFTRTGGGLEMAHADAGARCAAALDALDAAAIAFRAPFGIRARLSHTSAVRCCCAADPFAGDVANGTREPVVAVATGALDNVVRLWRTDGGDAGDCRALEGHESCRGASGVLALAPVRGAAGAVASAGRDGKVIVWASGVGGEASPARVLEGHGDGSGADVSNKQVVAALAAAPDGTIFSGGWDNTVRAWATDGSALVASEHQAAVLALCVLTDARVASGSGDGVVRVWRREPAALRCEATCRVGAVVRALCALDDGGFAQVANDGVVRVWGACGTLRRKSPFVGTNYVFTIAAVPGGGGVLELASGSDDGVVRIWHAEGDAALCCVWQAPFATVPVATVAALIVIVARRCACRVKCTRSRPSARALSSSLPLTTPARSCSLARPAAPRRARCNRRLPPRPPHARRQMAVAAAAAAVEEGWAVALEGVRVVEEQEGRAAGAWSTASDTTSRIRWRWAPRAEPPSAGTRETIRTKSRRASRSGVTRGRRLWGRPKIVSRCRAASLVVLAGTWSPPMSSVISSTSSDERCKAAAAAAAA